MTCRMEFSAEPDAALHDTIQQGLRGFNRSLFPRSPSPHDIGIALRIPDGSVVGGLWGRISGNWCAIEMIFVPASLRHKGLASALLQLAEEEASRRGCRQAWLDTLNGRAAELYERRGYRRFAELEDYAEGAARIFMRKSLDPS